MKITLGSFNLVFYKTKNIKRYSCYEWNKVTFSYYFKIKEMNTTKIKKKRERDETWDEVVLKSCI